MLELILLVISILIIFFAAIWYASYRSKQRSKQFELSRTGSESIPHQPEHEFGNLFQQQLAEDEPQQELESIETEPVLSLSPKAVSSSSSFDETKELEHWEALEARREEASDDFGQTQLGFDKFSFSQTAISSQSDGQTIIALTVVAKSGEQFSGAQLLQLFCQHSLKYGDMNIFHKLSFPDQQILFSVADILQPGSLEKSRLEQRQIKGLIFFIDLSLATNSLLAFEDMLKTASTIADKLNADLCNEQRNLLNEAEVEQLRSQIFNFSISQQTNPDLFKHDYSRWNYRP